MRSEKIVSTHGIRYSCYITCNMMILVCPNTAESTPNTIRIVYLRMADTLYIHRHRHLVQRWVYARERGPEEAVCSKEHLQNIDIVVQYKPHHEFHELEELKKKGIWG